MPKTKIRMSAVKSHRKDEKARVLNKSRRNTLATLEKKYRAVVASGDEAAAKAMLDAEYQALDKAVKYGTIHKNKAARKKSRLATLSAAKVAAPAAE